jgi:hypothetical protein
MPLTQGQRARVRRVGRADEWCMAEVALVSSNGASVALALEGVVRTADDGVILGVLPLLIDRARDVVEGLDGTAYEIEVDVAQEVSLDA